MTIAEKLDLLDNYRAALDALRLEKQEMIERLISPEIRAQIADIEAEFAIHEQAAAENAAALEAEIKTEVIATGATVKGAHLQAVYTKGRVSWDGAKLDGMMALIPGLREARKEGQPSVSFRRVG